MAVLMHQENFDLWTIIRSGNYKIGVVNDFGWSYTYPTADFTKIISSNFDITLKFLR